MALHTILVPYHFGSLRHGTGAGPEALTSNGVLSGAPVSGTTTITVESQASNASEERDVLLAGGRDLDRGKRVRLRRSNVRHYLPPASA